eukprot:TRINITY_DN6271_c0_g2_i12.p1 TRINITY_DN6271_c0_g2~~TRINITY_DN6271_c0_g2_i12.p1  ORF type:complete len:406 (+),score=79.46 TRINITY_DN6271_c0_g2_i12:984-2201(+)
MLLDPSNETSNVNAIVNSESDGMGEITGLFFSKNIIANGGVVMGSLYKPDYQNVFVSNQFVNSPLSLGTSQPGQFQVVQNTLINSRFSWHHMWGPEDERFPEKQQFVNVFSRNSLYHHDEQNNFMNVMLQTGIYVVDPRDSKKYVVQDSDLRSDDIWDANIYYNYFSASFHSNGIYETSIPPTKWQSLTTYGGNSFDRNSLFNLTLPPSQWFVVLNEYDQTRAHLTFLIHPPHVFPTIVSFDLCCLLSGKEWKLMDYSVLGRNSSSTVGISAAKGDGTVFPTKGDVLFYESNGTSGADGGCGDVRITFERNYFRFFLLKTSIDITSSQECPGFIPDVDPMQRSVVVPVKSGSSASVLIAAISGGGVFVICGAVAVLFYRLKQLEDLEMGSGIDAPPKKVQGPMRV